MAPPDLMLTPFSDLSASLLVLAESFCSDNLARALTRRYAVRGFDVRR